MSSKPVDPVDLTVQLVRCPSVTPAEGGALTLLESLLSDAGFVCSRIDRGGIKNLFARWGDKGHSRCFGFNGHIDVVPIGDEAAWTVDPFGGAIRDGLLWGRGATDMKSGVAAFVAAAVDYVREAPRMVQSSLPSQETRKATPSTERLRCWIGWTSSRKG